MEEHDAETYREAYESIANAQKKDDRVVAIVCRPGSTPNVELAKKVGISLDSLLVAHPRTVAEASTLTELLIRSNAAEVFNV